MRLKLFLLIILFSNILLSQGNSHGAVSLKFPITPFVASTGEAFVANSASLQSILINPANLALKDSYEIIFSHTEWIQDTRTEFLSVSAPLRYGTLALSISNSSVDEIELRDIPGPAIGTFSFQSTSFQLTYGIEMLENIRIGFSPKYIYEKIFINESSGFGFDAGLFYNKFVENLDIGISFTQIGSLLAFRNESVDLPSAFRIGGTYSIKIDQLNFRTAAAFTSELGTSYQHINLGADVRFEKLFSVRAGYQTGYDVRGLSMGIGIRYEFVNLDYAYLPFSKQAGNAHIISIGFNL